MATRNFDSVAELALAYRADMDDNHDDGWWASTDYTVASDHGTLHFLPARGAPVAEESQEAGIAPSPVAPPTQGRARGWKVSIDVPGGALERSFTDASLPEPAEAARQLEALARQAAPARHEERDRVISQLRELAAQRHKIDTEARRIALDAVSRGVKKIAVADAARISRVTLDRWIRG